MKYDEYLKMEPVSVVSIDKRLGEFGAPFYFVSIKSADSNLSICFSTMSSVLDFISHNF